MTPNKPFNIPGINKMQLLLVRSCYFEHVEPALTAELSTLTETEHFSTGQTLVKQGARGDCVYLLLSGVAEVTQKNSDGKDSIIAVMREGDWVGVGDTGLIPRSWERTATVTAKSPIDVLRIDAKTYNQFVADHPNFRVQIERSREKILFEHFIRKITFFHSLTVLQHQHLYDTISKQSVPAGTTVIEEGTDHDNCYFVFKGQVEVRIAKPAKKLAELGEGQVFGEMSLLTNTPCNASVMTKTDCELLVVRKEDLQKILDENTVFSESLASFLLQRSRPIAKDNIEVLHKETPEGTPLYVLKNHDTLQFFQLSNEGHFIWKMLDGTHTLRELMEEYLLEYKSFNLSHVSSLIMRLSEAGFVDIPKLSERANTEKSSMLGRLKNAFSTLKNSIHLFPHAADNISALFAKSKLRCCYNRWGFFAAFLTGCLGFYFFVVTGPMHINTLANAHNLWIYLLCLLPIRLVSICLHELGHAFMTLSYGQKLRSAGLGWYWLSPIAYIDTSSMWALPRKPRVMVDIAGILSDWLFAGALLIIAFFVPSKSFGALIYFYSLVAYLNILGNLNPLLKLDGYYLFMDSFDAPNLRVRALNWLKQAVIHPFSVARDRISLVYVIVVASYFSLMAFILYKLGHSILASLLPIHPSNVMIMTWALIATMVLFSVMSTLKESTLSSAK